MLKHTLLSSEGILILEPSDALQAADFEAVVHDMDPYLAEHGSLAGVMILAKAFPGWLNLEAALGWLKSGGDSTTRESADTAPLGEPR